MQTIFEINANFIFFQSQTVLLPFVIQYYSKLRKFLFDYDHFPKLYKKFK